MANKSPLQIVKDQYGSKDELISKIASLVDRDEGESEEEHKKRLKYVSNAKLLHLHDIATKAKELGGREGMVKTILELKGQPKDNEYKDSLEKRTLGQLIEGVTSLQRGLQRAAAKAKKKAG